MQGIIGSVTAAEKEREASKRGSRSSSGSTPVTAQTFVMPRSFEKVKRGGLDGRIDFVSVIC